MIAHTYNVVRYLNYNSCCIQSRFCCYR